MGGRANGIVEVIGVPVIATGACMELVELVVETDEESSITRFFGTRSSSFSESPSRPRLPENRGHVGHLELMCVYWRVKESWGPQGQTMRERRVAEEVSYLP